MAFTCVESFEPTVISCIERARNTSKEPNSDLFHVILQERMEIRLKRDDLWLLHCIRCERDAALAEARRGRYNLSSYYLYKAKSVSGRLLGVESRLIADTFYNSVRAYLAYKLREHGRAARCLEEALGLDSELEDRYGYSVMHAHKIQILHNFIRLCRQNNEYRNASYRISSLLKYIENTELPDEGGCWGFLKVLSVPSTLLDALHLQVLGELCLLLAGQGDADLNDLFALSVSNYSGTLSEPSGTKAIAAWLLAKRLYFAFVEAGQQPRVQMAAWSEFELAALQALERLCDLNPIMFASILIDLLEISVCELGLKEYGSKIARSSASLFSGMPTELQYKFNSILNGYIKH